MNTTITTGMITTMTTITTRINTIDQFATTYAAANATGQLARIDAERPTRMPNTRMGRKARAKRNPDPRFVQNTPAGGSGLCAR